MWSKKSDQMSQAPPKQQLILPGHIVSTCTVQMVVGCGLCSLPLLVQYRYSLCTLVLAQDSIYSIFVTTRSDKQFRRTAVVLGAIFRLDNFKIYDTNIIIQLNHLESFYEA